MSRLDEGLALPGGGDLERERHAERILTLCKVAVREASDSESPRDGGPIGEAR